MVLIIIWLTRWAQWVFFVDDVRPSGGTPRTPLHKEPLNEQAASQPANRQAQGFD